jgi:hypothetical protein
METTNVLVKKAGKIALVIASIALGLLFFGGPFFITGLALGFRLPASECSLASDRVSWSDNSTCDLISATTLRVADCAGVDGATMCDREAIKATACVVLLRCEDGSLRNATSLLSRFDNHTVSHLFGTPGGAAADLCGQHSARAIQIVLNPRTVNDLNQSVSASSASANASTSSSSLDACNELDSRNTIAEFSASCVSREWWFSFSVAFVSIYAIVVCLGCAGAVSMDCRDAGRKGFRRLLTDTPTPTPHGDGDDEEKGKSVTPAA